MLFRQSCLVFGLVLSIQLIPLNLFLRQQSGCFVIYTYAACELCPFIILLLMTLAIDLDWWLPVPTDYVVIHGSYSSEKDFERDVKLFNSRFFMCLLLSMLILSTLVWSIIIATSECALHDPGALTQYVTRLLLVTMGMVWFCISSSPQTPSYPVNEEIPVYVLP